MKNALKVEFINKMEIRMGSPFNHCSIKTQGFSISGLSVGGFQDLINWSADGKYLTLVKWNINTSNESGFNIYIIDTSLEQVLFSTDRIGGICKSIELMDNELKYETLENGEEIIKVLRWR